MSAAPPFQPFLDAHRDEIHRFLVAALGAVEADDAFQETWISALRAWPKADHRGNLRAWVFTIARNKAMDAHRGRARRAVPLGAPDELPPIPAREAGGSRDAELWARVRALPPKQRMAVLLRFVGDLPHAEIAVVLRCSDDAARRSLHEGLTRLRKEMTP